KHSLDALLVPTEGQTRPYPHLTMGCVSLDERGQIRAFLQVNIYVMASSMLVIRPPHTAPAEPGSPAASTSPNCHDVGDLPRCALPDDPTTRLPRRRVAAMKEASLRDRDPHTAC